MTSSDSPTPKRPIMVLAGILTLGLMALGGLAIYDSYIKEDSGIVACRAMRDDRETSMDFDGNGEFSDEEYAAVRDMFADSGHEDIREHGEALVELTWRMTKAPDSDEPGAFASVDEIADHASELQTACAEQGIVVNLMDN